MRADPGIREVEIKEGLPESMHQAILRDGRPAPQLDKELVVKVRVTPDTVCVAGLRAGDLDDFRVWAGGRGGPAAGNDGDGGQQDAACRRRGVLPFLRVPTQVPAEVARRAAFRGDDPQRPREDQLGRDGVHAFPVHGGKVVYFAAGLVPGLALKGGEAAPAEAVRPGMRGSSGALFPWAVGGCRPYRAAWEKGEWSSPQLVELPSGSLPMPARGSRGSTRTRPRLLPRSGRARSAAAGFLPAGERPGTVVAVEKVDVPGGPSVGDAQRFGTAPRGSGVDGLRLRRQRPVAVHGRQARPAVAARINTMGPEYAPRLGLKQSLYFCRADRQLLFSGGIVQEVRLPGKQRHPLLEAVPAREGSTAALQGSALYARRPRLGPRGGAAGRRRLGKPVLLDDWKPE